LRSTLANPKSLRLLAGKTWTCRCGTSSPAGVKCPSDRPADQLGDGHDSAERRLIDALPFVDLRSRHHQRVPLRHRLDGQECDDVVVFVDEPTGQFPIDDLGEDGGHCFSICRVLTD
jgi:hypothetical protein